MKTVSSAALKRRSSTVRCVPWSRWLPRRAAFFDCFRKVKIPTSGKGGQKWAPTQFQLGLAYGAIQIPALRFRGSNPGELEDPMFLRRWR